MEFRTAWLRVSILKSLVALMVALCTPVSSAQEPVLVEAKASILFGDSALQHLRDDDVGKAFDALGEASDLAA